MIDYHFQKIDTFFINIDTFFIITGTAFINIDPFFTITDISFINIDPFQIKKDRTYRPVHNPDEPEPNKVETQNVASLQILPENGKIS